MRPCHATHPWSIINTETFQSWIKGQLGGDSNLKCPWLLDLLTYCWSRPINKEHLEESRRKGRACAGCGMRMQSRDQEQEGAPLLEPAQNGICARSCCGIIKPLHSRGRDSLTLYPNVQQREKYCISLEVRNRM